MDILLLLSLELFDRHLGLFPVGCVISRLFPGSLSLVIGERVRLAMFDTNTRLMRCHLVEEGIACFHHFATQVLGLLLAGLGRSELDPLHATDTC